MRIERTTSGEEELPRGHGLVPLRGRSFADRERLRIDNLARYLPDIQRR